jgi:hypothetical protein
MFKKLRKVCRRGGRLIEDRDLRPNGSRDFAGG